MVEVLALGRQRWPPQPVSATKIRVPGVIQMLKHLCAFLVVLPPLLALALTTTLTREVRDPSGAAIAKAKVTARNVGTNISRPTLTNETGQYTIPLLQRGSYETSAEAAGFKRAIETGLTCKSAAFSFAGEAFNIANHPTFNYPSATINKAAAGQITAAADPRQIQPALKLLF
jgi:hypothetical protein